MEVLFEDNHSIVVVKPAGMPIQSDLTGDPSLLEELKNFLREKYHKPGEAFVGLVHRLDRPVGGVVVFAKTSKGAARLSEQFRAHEVEKTYWALVEGTPSEKTGQVIQYIEKNKRLNRARGFDRPRHGAKYAELSYRVLKSDSDQSLIEIKPKTGRSHQIRLAMSTLSCPIIGDIKYGARQPLKDRTIALFAQTLTFRTVVGNEPVTITAQPGWKFN
ncbi:RNA pseudouridine synthase [Patescibacteria group bacterium]|nr:RNA pseudouridine synthase [Patescibacteria group bacterium]MBU1028882.1 RNA pseudouridine synthase [Patescibacteria group bacterium]MBU1916319.1 RNA pseudouridine synthase [Patescibacteria group bacterium]